MSLGAGSSGTNTSSTTNAAVYLFKIGRITMLSLHQWIAGKVYLPVL